MSEYDNTEYDNIPHVFHVSHYIIEEMEARGWDRDTLAVMMGFKDERDYGITRLSLDFLLDIKDPDMYIGEDLSERLGRAFGVSPELFTRLDDTWRNHPSVRAIQQPTPPEPTKEGILATLKGVKGL